MTRPNMPEMALRSLLSEQPAAQPRRIAALLDSLTHSERVAAIYGLRGSQLGTLFQLVEGFAEFGIDGLVPATTPPLTPVRHIGRNSMALFSHFEKRFYRVDDGVAGANFQPFSFVTGPGYFVARRDSQHAEVLLDYQQLPSQTPAGWPAVCTNEKGIGQLVYGWMTDAMRRVSEHVSIGSAARHGKSIGTYFVLCREES